MATTKSTLFTVSKDEWDTKEDTGKSMKNALYVLRYAKRHLSGRSDVEQWKNQAVALAVIELCLSESISQLLTQSVSQSVENKKILSPVATCWKHFRSIWKLVWT